MGLDTTHDCWHGAYGSFEYWRREIAKAAGLPKLKSMVGFGGNRLWSSLEPSPLHLLLNHSDCDGELRWQDCGAIADELEKLIPKLTDWSAYKAEQFVKGLRLASANRENVEFH